MANQFQQHFLHLLQQPDLPPDLQPPPQPAPQPAPQPTPDQDPTVFEFIRGRRVNSRQLLYYGYRYMKTGSHNDTQYYRCIHHKRDALNNPLPCKSLVHFSDGVITRQPTPHNHRSDDELNTVKSVISTIKTASSSSRIAPSLAVANATSGLSAAERLLLPSLSAMKKVSQRAYRIAHPNQRAPPTLDDLILSDADLLNGNQQPMLVYDNHHATKRIIVLGSPSGYQALSTAQHWASDCTFKSSPRLTEQVSKVLHTQSFSKIQLLLQFLSK